MCSPPVIRQQRFQSTPPARGATFLTACRGRQELQFQSTPPARGATRRKVVNCTEKLFQSTPPARGATTPKQRTAADDRISIHAPREGGDVGHYFGVW